MMRDLTTTNGNAAEVARARATVESLYASIERDLHRLYDMLPALPTPEVRKALELYRRDLYAKLRPISNAMVDRDKATTAVAGLLQDYINARSSDPGATVRAYVQALMDQPLFAIYQAIDDFRNGRVFDIGKDGERIPFTLDHAPTAPRLLSQVKKRAADVQEEHFKVGRILAVTKTIDTPKVSDEERGRVAELMQRLAKNMAVNSETIRVEERRKIQDDAQAARDRAARIIHDAKRRNEEAYSASVMEQANG